MSALRQKKLTFYSITLDSLDYSWRQTKRTAQNLVYFPLIALQIRYALAHWCVDRWCLMCSCFSLAINPVLYWCFEWNYVYNEIICFNYFLTYTSVYDLCLLTFVNWFIARKKKSESELRFLDRWALSLPFHFCRYRWNDRLTRWNHGPHKWGPHSYRFVINWNY